MKVITQLVQHFWQRGVLTIDDADYLVRSGFVRESDLPGFKLVDRPAGASAQAEDIMSRLLVDGPLDAAEESLVRTGMRRGKSGGGRQPALDQNELRTRLQREFDRRAEHLESLVTVCRTGLKVSFATWEEAASHLRNLPPLECVKLLASQLHRRGIELNSLWNAVDVEAFHRLLNDGERRGRTARSYLALLLVQDAASLGKHAWILNIDEVQAVSNLLWVRLRLLEMLKELYAVDRRTLSHCLGRTTNPTATWSMILLHNAHRLDKKRLGRRMEYGPIEPPDTDVWTRAWTIALEMNRPHVSRLLAHCYSATQDELPAAPSDACRPLFCPTGWKLPPREEPAQI
jgi:hypothetical protein